MVFIDLKDTAASIIAWYAQHKRDLPWRMGKDPYRIWISEIMLQQTRIEAVIPYYERFLAALPNVAALAAVSDDRLMKLWEGLGYYSRARNLKKAAMIVMEQYAGNIPETAQELKKLPGIGSYTAGSIASIAFGLPEPAVDGNVMRVLSRLSAFGGDVIAPGNRKEAERQLREIYPSGDDAALLTEGLMELGERICIPNGIPLCGQCPVSAFCQAHRSGMETGYPLRSGNKARRIEERTVFLFRCGASFAICRRPAKGLLAGMWEFPNRNGRITAQEALSYAEERGLRPLSVKQAGEAKHIFTHIEWHMTGYAIECKETGKDLVWVTKEELETDYSVPTAFKFYKNQLQYL